MYRIARTPVGAIRSLAVKSTTWTTASQRALSAKVGGESLSYIMKKRFPTASGSLTFGFSDDRMGHLSESSVLVTAGGSVVHVAVNSSNKPIDQLTVEDDFLPLTVDYRARMSAFGLVSDERRRKEKHGSDEEILVGRFIDRAVRALFPKQGYVQEVQILATNHAADGIHDPTVLAVNAASMALLKSKQPWFGPIGCVRVGVVHNKLVVNPTVKEMEHSPLDLLYAGTASRAVMIEAGGSQVPEAIMKDALTLAHSSIQEIIAAQLVAMSSVPAQSKRAVLAVNSSIVDSLKAKHWDAAVTMFRSGGDQKEGRSEQEGLFRAQMLQDLQNDAQFAEQTAFQKMMAIEKVMHAAFRAAILDPNESNVNVNSIVRSDGRNINTLRPIASQVNVLPSVHGSSYFTRGDTHVMCSTTLASLDFARPGIPLNGLGMEKRDLFHLHYDFPPYCTGELGNITAANRRAIGHGNLAEKAVAPVLPSFEEFPYVVKVHSECTSSNGSSSMASACGATLSLLSAGVPIRAPVAGVSVGLITEDKFSKFLSPEQVKAELEKPETQRENEYSSGQFVLLKDILGSEDHNGDMDFKIAGSAKGITAIQLDVKLPGGVPLPILFEAMDIARQGRLDILDRMLQPLGFSSSLTPLKNEKQMTSAHYLATKFPALPHAPCAELIRFNPERKPQLIGPNAEMIKFIENLFDVELTIVNKADWQHITQYYVPAPEASNESNRASASLSVPFDYPQKRPPASTSSLISAQVFEDEIGIAYVFGRNADYVREAKALIEDIAVTVKEGDEVVVEIIDVRDYGAIVNVNRGQQAILRLSEISHNPSISATPMKELMKKGHRVRVKIVSVEKSTGLVVVSRKALLNPDLAASDTVELLPPLQKANNVESIEALREKSAQFPMTPPRPWNRDFFQLQVANEREVNEAMNTQRSAAHRNAPVSIDDAIVNQHRHRPSSHARQGPQQRVHNKKSHTTRSIDSQNGEKKNSTQDVSITSEGSVATSSSVKQHDKKQDLKRKTSKDLESAIGSAIDAAIDNLDGHSAAPVSSPESTPQSSVVSADPQKDESVSQQKSRQSTDRRRVTGKHLDRLKSFKTPAQRNSTTEQKKKEAGSSTKPEKSEISKSELTQSLDNPPAMLLSKVRVKPLKHAPVKSSSSSADPTPEPQAAVPKHTNVDATSSTGTSTQS